MDPQKAWFQKTSPWNPSRVCSTLGCPPGDSASKPSCVASLLLAICLLRLETAPSHPQGVLPGRCGAAD